MHELLLFAQVPLPRHAQLLKILAGVAAMQPQRIVERHVIYKPLREPEEPGSHLKRGGHQNITQKQTKAAAPKDLYYTRIVHSLTEDDFVRTSSSPDDNGNGEDRADDKGAWSMQFQDVPDTGDRGVLVRLTASTDILSGGQPTEYMTHLGNTFVTEYYQEGHRFVHGNIVILLYRLLQVPGVRALESAPAQVLPEFSDLKPIDPSGGYLLQATIRVQDLSNPTILEDGITELKAFKRRMEGCIALDVPDRLLLDTRVKWVPPKE